VRIRMELELFELLMAGTAEVICKLLPPRRLRLLQDWRHLLAKRRGSSDGALDL
jgi:hypothetical protein